MHILQIKTKFVHQYNNHNYTLSHKNNHHSWVKKERRQDIAIYFSPCILSLCLPLLTHTIIHHSFADDLQLQMSAPPDRISALLHSMQSCIGDVKVWATANMLKLNDNKTELMLVTSKRTKHIHSLPTSITMGNAQIPFKQSVKN